MGEIAGTKPERKTSKTEIKGAEARSACRCLQMIAAQMGITLHHFCTQAAAKFLQLL